MARRDKSKKDKITDPFERVRLKKLRAQQRREERKRRRLEDGDEGRRRSRSDPKPSPGVETDLNNIAVTDPHAWIRRSMTQAFAWRIVNEHRVLPYWLSIEFEGGNPPTAGYYPCHHRRAEDGRYHYGFLFRECRDIVFEKWQHEYDARKELTPDR